jgi:hypothetical protein
MSTKVITVWLILLTAWVVFGDMFRHENLELRNKRVEIRKQKFEEIDANLKYLKAETETLRQHINGPLNDSLNEMQKYSHKH